MLYIKSINIPRFVVVEGTKTETLRVWKGVIHKIDVFIPAGHAGLARLQIFLGEHIIMPVNQDSYISGDNTTVSGKYFIDIGKGVSTIKLKGWNTDDSNTHEFIVRIGVLPKWVVLPQIMIQKAIEMLSRLFV